LASAGYYDPIYFETYSEALKKEYLSKGFVFVEISKPRLITDDSDKSLTIEYVIAEKQQVKLKSLILNKIPEQLQEGVRKVLTNQQGEPLNVVELENDLRKMIVYFQSEGYYFASITNLNADTLLNYDKTYSFAELKPEISLDKQICFNEAIINGNSKTQSVVINREIEFQKGELINPAKIENLRQKLSGLNLFSSLRITPYMMYGVENEGCPQTNLVIQVKEKYGTLRFYYDGGDEKIDGMVRMAEAMSAVTCEVCGNAGKFRGRGWYYTSCDEHAREEDEE
jgi:outer membrane protein assembly factor BamA